MKQTKPCWRGGKIRRSSESIAPDVYFSGFAYRGDVLPYARKQGPSQRSGTWLSMQLLEPWLAFYEADFALATLLQRQDWPARPGVHDWIGVRKLSVSDFDRNTRMWDKVSAPNAPPRTSLFV